MNSRSHQDQASSQTFQGSRVVPPNRPACHAGEAVYFKRWLPIVFVRAHARWFRKSRWRKHSNFMPKSRTRSRSKMPTNMASKLLKFVYWKCCLDRLWFQNICRLNKRPYLSLLDLKERCTRYARVSTNEADLFDRHDHRALPHIFAVLGIVCGAATNAKI